MDSLTLFASYGSVCRMLYDNDGKKRLFKKRHGQSLTFLFKAIRSLPKAMAIRMWFTVLAPKSRCQRQHVSAHGELFEKPPMTILYDPMWKKNLSRKDTDRANVPIQNPWVFAKGNDDWVCVKKLSGVSRQSSFHGMKRAVLEHFKNGRGALTHCLWQQRFVASDVDRFFFFCLERDAMAFFSPLLSCRPNNSDVSAGQEWPEVITGGGAKRSWWA